MPGELSLAAPQRHPSRRFVSRKSVGDHTSHACLPWLCVPNLLIAALHVAVITYGKGRCTTYS